MREGVAETADEPVVSVLVVADYESGTAASWEELRRTLAALAVQDCDVPFEVLLCENDSLAPTMPDDIPGMVAGMRVVRDAATTSNGLKNAAARAARAPLLAIIDADVVPARDWLRHLVAAIERDRRIAVVSGRSLHLADGFLPRALALIERGYVDGGHAGPTIFLASHACLYRREWYLAHPCHENEGPFSSRLQSEAIRRAGGRLYFEPAARSFHIYAGLAAQADIARNAGYGTIVTRLRDRRLPYAWLTHLGRLGLPLFIGGKTYTGLVNCLRLYRHYGIRPYELPGLLAIAVALHCLEARGMWVALQGRTLAGTAYR